MPQFNLFSNRIAKFSNRIANRIALVSNRIFKLQIESVNRSNHDLNHNCDWDLPIIGTQPREILQKQEYKTHSTLLDSSCLQFWCQNLEKCLASIYHH